MSHSDIGLPSRCRLPTSTILSVMQPSYLISHSSQLLTIYCYSLQLTFMQPTFYHFLLSIHTYSPLVLTFQWIPVEKIGAPPSAWTCDLPPIRLALCHLTVCVPVQEVTCFNIYRCISSQQFRKWVLVPFAYIWSSQSTTYWTVFL